MAGSRPTDSTSRDFLELLQRCGRTDSVVELMRRFGDATPETALVSKVFYFDGDAEFHTQLRPQNPRNLTFQLALLRLFTSPGLDSDRLVFRRWQHATRNLLLLRERRMPQRPWLYGWAMFGVILSAREADRTHRRAAIAAAEPVLEALRAKSIDAMPRSLERLAKMLEADVVEVLELRLIDALLGPLGVVDSRSRLMAPIERVG